MKINVRDKVKIMRKGSIDQYTTYGFEVGEKYEVEAILGNRLTISNGRFNGYIYKNNVELIQKNTFTNESLKNGDKCILKNGKVIIFNKDNSYQKTTYVFENLDSNLKYNLNDDVSIVKVERPVKYKTIFQRVEEERKEILDKVEKNYLKIIIKPIRSKIKYIEKDEKISLGNKEFLVIYIKDEAMMIFPSFKKGTMYSGMKLNKKYTLEELEI
jgi:predicted ribosome-associated RNA-binding protein Tma20